MQAAGPDRIYLQQLASIDPSAYLAIYSSLRAPATLDFDINDLVSEWDRACNERDLPCILARGGHGGLSGQMTWQLSTEAV